MPDLTPADHRDEAERLLARANDSTSYDEAAGIVALAHVHALLAGPPVVDLDPAEFTGSGEQMAWWQFCLVLIVLAGCIAAPIWALNR